MSEKFPPVRTEQPKAQIAPEQSAQKEELPYEEVIQNPNIEADPNNSPLAFLGLKESATQAQIKRRFRELALRYHPDSHSGEANEELFKKLGDAYETARAGVREWTKAERGLDRAIRTEIIRRLENYIYFRECLIDINVILENEQFPDKASMENRFREVRREYMAKDMNYESSGWPRRFDPQYVQETIAFNKEEIDHLTTAIKIFFEELDKPGPLSEDITTKY